MTAEFHKANRQRLYAEMKDGSAAVFFSGSAPRQSADAYYTSVSYTHLTLPTKLEV